MLKSTLSDVDIKTHVFPPKLVKHKPRPAADSKDFIDLVNQRPDCPHRAETKTNPQPKPKPLAGHPNRSDSSV